MAQTRTCNTTRSVTPTPQAKYGQRKLVWVATNRPLRILLQRLSDGCFGASFGLDKPLTNGCDRIVVLSPEDITTRLSHSDEDFIYRWNNARCILNSNGPESGSADAHGSLFALNGNIDADYAMENQPRNEVLYSGASALDSLRASDENFMLLINCYRFRGHKSRISGRNVFET